MPTKIQVKSGSKSEIRNQNTKCKIFNDNNVHLMIFAKDFNRHYRGSLFDLIPHEITRLNRRSVDPLIVGFIKEFERGNQMIFVPMDLRRLIVQFYPIFLETHSSCAYSSA